MSALTAASAAASAAASLNTGAKITDPFGNSYTLGSLLGTGFSGTVFSIISNQPQALSKKLAAKIFTSTTSDRSIQAEQERLQKAQLLPHGPGFSLFFIDQGQRILLMRNFGYNLLDLRNRALTFSDKVCLAIQLIEFAIAFHKQGQQHGDLKPENLFFDPQSRCLTVGDFGKGHTFSYRSPESLLKAPDLKDYDAYSIGCILYECFVGKPLISHNPQHEKEDWAISDALRRIFTCIGRKPPRSYWEGAQKFSLFFKDLPQGEYEFTMEPSPEYKKYPGESIKALGNQTLVEVVSGLIDFGDQRMPLETALEKLQSLKQEIQITIKIDPGYFANSPSVPLFLWQGDKPCFSKTFFPSEPLQDHYHIPLMQPLPHFSCKLGTRLTPEPLTLANGSTLTIFVDKVTVS